MQVSTNFNEISFHDCGVERIYRTSCSVELEIEGGCIASTSGSIKSFDECKLSIFNVMNEEIDFWNDDKTPKVHPHPDMPICEIMHSNFHNGVFTIEGFTKNSEWVEWRIYADTFLLEVKSDADNY